MFMGYFLNRLNQFFFFGPKLIRFAHVTFSEASRLHIYVRKTYIYKHFVRMVWVLSDSFKGDEKMFDEIISSACLTKPDIQKIESSFIHPYIF